MKRLASHSIWPAETGGRSLYSALCSVAVLSNLQVGRDLESKTQSFPLKILMESGMKRLASHSIWPAEIGGRSLCSALCSVAVLSKLHVGRDLESKTQSFPFKILMESGMKRLAFHSIWPAETGERFLFSALCSVAMLSKLCAEGLLEVEHNHFHLKSSWEVVWNV